MVRFAKRMETLGTENAFTVGAHIRRVADGGMEVIRFNLGEPDFDSADHINQEAIAQIVKGNSHYTDPQGIIGLREAVARHVSDTRGVPVTPDRVVVTPGAKPPIGYSMQTYVDPGDEVVYPSPGFPIYESWATFAGARPRPLHLSEEREFGFGAEDLAAIVGDRTKLVILNSPSNPTGGVLSATELADIAGVIRDRCHDDVRVFSDEVYEHILFDGLRHHSIISEPGMADRTVLVSGHSKSFAMTGWRLGWVVLPTAEEADAFTQLNINTVSCVPPFIQEAGRVALESPDSRGVVSDMITAFSLRRDWVVPALNAIEGVSCRLPKGAFYVFPNIGGVCQHVGAIQLWSDLPASARNNTTPAGMFQMFLLYRYGVATMDRNSFGSIGSDDQHFLRLSIATTLENIQEGIRRFERAAQDRAGFQDFVESDGLHLFT